MEKEKPEVEPYYDREAKHIIDTMFDTHIFKETVTRDDMNGFQDLLGYIMQSHAHTAQKMAKWKAEWDLQEKNRVKGS